MKRILIHSLVFSPDSVSTAYLYNDIAIGLKEYGYDVIILTTTPHYNLIKESIDKQPLKKHFFGFYYSSIFNKIKVIHVPLRKHNSIIIRLLSFLYWHLFSYIIGISLKNINYILSPSPPLSIGIVSFLIAKRHKAKFIYNVQEIYPDLLIKNGSLKFKPIIYFLKYIEKFIYNNASAIITIDQIFYDQIKDRVLNTNKIRIIPNFVDTNLYKSKIETNKILHTYQKEGNSTILLYAGNIGYYQDWDPILYAANILKDKNIQFWIIGEGVRKQYLVNEIYRLNLTNIKIFPYQDRQLIPIFNHIADIHFISINKKMEQEGFPSKVYTIMASAKPMIIISGENSPIYKFLENLNCSILIKDNRNQNFVKSILDLAQNKDLQRILGQNGLEIIEKYYTKEIIINKYLNLFSEL